MKNFTVIFCFVFACATVSAQSIINVPGDQPTIQAGIDAASDGDTVLVAENTYFENINFNGKAITVASHFIMYGDTSHISATIIDGSQAMDPDSASTVCFVSGEDTTSILSGFTITGGTGTYISFIFSRSGGGIYCFNSGAKITHNKITANSVTGTNDVNGGGIGSFVTMGKHWVVVEDNVISNNLASADGLWAYGGGMLIAVNARICNNTIENNQCINTTDSSYADGGGVFWATWWGVDDTVYFRNNILRNNTCFSAYRARGGGIYADKSHAFITDNQMINNTVEGDDRARGGAINYQQVSGNILIEDNVINSNISDGYYNSHGSSMRIANFDATSEVRIINNEISNNITTSVAAWSWGGIFFWNSQDAKVVIDGNLFKNNQSKHAGAIFAQQSYNLSIINNIFDGDSATYEGGAIQFFENSAGLDRDGFMGFPGESIGDHNRSVTSEMHPIVMNNTFVGNSAKWGGAITNYYNANVPVILNNIFWDNTATNSTGMGKDIDNFDSDSTIYVGYCNLSVDSILGNWEGKFNIDFDPWFADSTYHLSDTSECINKGIDIFEVWGTIYYCPQSDCDGEPRPDTSCFIADIGADEVMGVCTGVPEISREGRSFLLAQNHPNPFSNSTVISWQLDNDSYVELGVYDITGKQVARLVSEKQAAGNHQYEWTTEDLPAGIYFYKLTAGNQAATGKMVLLK